MKTLVDMAHGIEGLHAELVELEALARAASDALEHVPGGRRDDAAARRAQDRLDVFVSLAAKAAEGVLTRAEDLAGGVPLILASTVPPSRKR